MEDIKKKLLDLSDEKHRAFQLKLVPNIQNILGIKTPELRKISKEILKWKNPLEYLNFEKEFFEEIVLEGLIIGNSKIAFEDKLKLTESYIPKLDNWASCDIFCGTLKETKKYKEKMFQFIKPYLESQEEFEIRFGVVMLLSYYIEENYLNFLFTSFNNIKHEGYYVKMAVAWAISICFVKFPEKTMEYLKECQLDKFTYNKSLQKITESFRVSSETKKLIKAMKV